MAVHFSDHALKRNIHDRQAKSHVENCFCHFICGHGVAGVGAAAGRGRLRAGRGALLQGAYE
jgi:hypothetical protein